MSRTATQRNPSDFLNVQSIQVINEPSSPEQKNQLQLIISFRDHNNINATKRLTIAAYIDAEGFFVGNIPTTPFTINAKLFKSNSAEPHPEIDRDNGQIQFKFADQRDMLRVWLIQKSNGNYALQFHDIGNFNKNAPNFDETTGGITLVSYSSDDRGNLTLVPKSPDSKATPAAAAASISTSPPEPTPATTPAPDAKAATATSPIYIERFGLRVNRSTNKVELMFLPDNSALYQGNSRIALKISTWVDDNASKIEKTCLGTEVAISDIKIIGGLLDVTQKVGDEIEILPNEKIQYSDNNTRTLDPQQIHLEYKHERINNDRLRLAFANGIYILQFFTNEKKWVDLKQCTLDKDGNLKIYSPSKTPTEAKDRKEKFEKEEEEEEINERGPTTPMSPLGFQPFSFTARLRESTKKDKKLLLVLLLATSAAAIVLFTAPLSTILACTIAAITALFTAMLITHLLNKLLDAWIGKSSTRFVLEGPGAMTKSRIFLTLSFVAIGIGVFLGLVALAPHVVVAAGILAVLKCIAISCGVVAGIMLLYLRRTEHSPAAKLLQDTLAQGRSEGWIGNRTAIVDEDGKIIGHESDIPIADESRVDSDSDHGEAEESDGDSHRPSSSRRTPGTLCHHSPRVEGGTPLPAPGVTPDSP